MTLLNQQNWLREKLFLHRRQWPRAVAARRTTKAAAMETERTIEAILESLAELEQRRQPGLFDQE